MSSPSKAFELIRFAYNSTPERWYAHHGAAAAFSELEPKRIDRAVG
jgi:hypothetical protein